MYVIANQKSIHSEDGPSSHGEEKEEENLMNNLHRQA